MGFRRLGVWIKEGAPEEKENVLCFRNLGPSSYAIAQL